MLAPPLMTTPRWTGIDTATPNARATFLFLHGFPFDHRIWREQYHRLPSQGIRAIAPDLPGFGGSELASDVDCVTMDEYADSLIRLLDHLQVTTPLTVVGLSMGGYIALAMVELFASRVDRLILCDTRSESDSPETVANRLRTAEQALREPSAEFLADGMIPKLLSSQSREQRPELESLVRSTMRVASPRGVAAAARGMTQRPDRSHVLRHIAIPVDFVVGDQDTFSPPAVMENMRQMVPPSVPTRMTIVPNAAHLAPLELKRENDPIS